MGHPVGLECGFNIVCVLVGIESNEEIDLSVDAGTREGTGVRLEITLGEGNGAISAFHGIDEPGSFWVSKICKH